MAAGRYSAGRIFLQVVPSFKNVQRDTRREVGKLNDQMSKDMDAASDKAGKRAGEKAGASFLMGFEKKAVADQQRLNKTLEKGLLDLDKARRASYERSKKAAEKVWNERRAEAARQRKIWDRDQRKAAEAKAAREEREAAAADRREAARLKKRGRQQAAAYAEDRRRADAKRRDEAKAQREYERWWDAQMDKADAKERARMKKRASEHARALAQNIAFDKKALLARQALEAKAAAADDKALQERMLRRGGLARAEVEKAVKAIEKNLGDVDLATPIGRELDKIKRHALGVSRDLSAGVIDVDRARREMEALGRDAERLMRRVRPGGVSMNTSDRGNLRATVRDLRSMSQALDGANSRGGMMSRWLRGASGDGQDGANAFRIFNYRVLGVAAALPLLIPLLAAVGAGLVGLATSALGAAAGLGVMFLAFSGIGDAVKAMGDVQDNAKKDGAAAAKTMRNAARSVRDAQQGLVQARQAAARAAEDSNRRIADAEENLADAQRDAAKAQDDLREARARAQADQDALADRIASGQLDERQALIDLFNAQVQYNAAMADGGATNLEKEQASIDLGRAQLAIKGIRAENKAMAAEQVKFAKQGVNGSEDVQAAQERAQDAVEGVRDAEQGVADARRDAGEQAADSARQIRDAQERLTDAQESYTEAVTQTGDLGSASMQKLETAMGKLSPAGQAFALYLFSLQGYFRDLRAIAQEGMLPGVQEAMESMIGRYGPGFARYVGVMAKAIGDFFVLTSQTLQSPVWERFFAMMERNGPLFGRVWGEGFLNIATGFAGLMTAFEPFTVDFSEALIRMTESFAEWGTSLGESEGFQSFLAYMEKTGPKVWDLLENIVGAFVNLGVALAPIADKLLDFAITFFGWIADMDPDVLAGLATAIIGFVLASQLAAGATQLLITLTTPFHSILGLFVFLLVAVAAGLVYAYQHSERFAEIVDRVLGIIKDNWQTVMWLGGAFAALGTILFGTWKFFSLFMGKIGALRYIFAAMTGPIGWVILGITLLVAALIWLWNNNEDFKNGVIAAWGQIQQAAMWLWENAIKPYFTFMVQMWLGVAKVLWWLWTDVASPVFGFIGGIITWLWGNVMGPLLSAMFAGFTMLAQIIGWVWSIIGPIFQLIGAVFKALWDVTLGPVLGWIGGKFQWLADKIAAVYNKFIYPVLDKFGLAGADLKGKWDRAIQGVGAAWASLQDLVKKPMRFIVETVINKGFVDNFNKLATFFGTDEIKPMKLDWLNSAPASGPGSYGASGPSGKNTHGYATGGWTGPGAKYQPAGVVHADEYVIRKESTNRLRRKYGLGALEYINEFGELPGAGGYATGGLVGGLPVYKQMGAWVRANLPGKVITSDYRPGAITALGNVSNHGKGLAVDIGPPDMAAFNEIKAKFGKAILQLIYSPANGAQVLNGKNFMYDAVTRRGHWDHIHWAMRSMAAGAGIGGGGGGSFFDWFSNPVDFIQKKINGYTKGLGDNPFGKFLTAVPAKLMDMAADSISGMVGFGESEDKSPGYARGGLVAGMRDNGTMMYDNGGYLPPGITTVMNLTGRPEPVFTADQWDGMGEGGGGGSLIGNLDIDLNGSDVTAGDVVSEIMYQVERVSHGGKYAGRAD